MSSDPPGGSGPPAASHEAEPTNSARTECPIAHAVPTAAATVPTTTPTDATTITTPNATPVPDRRHSTPTTHSKSPDDLSPRTRALVQWLKRSPSTPSAMSSPPIVSQEVGEDDDTSDECGSGSGLVEGVLAEGSTASVDREDRTRDDEGRRSGYDTPPAAPRPERPESIQERKGEWIIVEQEDHLHHIHRFREHVGPWQGPTPPSRPTSYPFTTWHNAEHAAAQVPPIPSPSRQRVLRLRTPPPDAHAGLAAAANIHGSPSPSDARKATPLAPSASDNFSDVSQSTPEGDMGAVSSDLPSHGPQAAGLLLAKVASSGDVTASTTFAQPVPLLPSVSTDASSPIDTRAVDDRCTCPECEVLAHEGRPANPLHQPLWEDADNDDDAGTPLSVYHDMYNPHPLRLMRKIRRKWSRQKDRRIEDHEYQGKLKGVDPHDLRRHIVHMNNRERKSIAWRPYRNTSGRSPRYNRDPAPIEGRGTPALRQAAPLVKPTRVYNIDLPQKPRVPKIVEGASDGSGGSALRPRRTYIVRDATAGTESSDNALEYATEELLYPLSLSSSEDAAEDEQVLTAFPSTVSTPTRGNSPFSILHSPDSAHLLYTPKSSRGPATGPSFAEKLKLARYRRAHTKPPTPPGNTGTGNDSGGSSEQELSDRMEEDEPIEQPRSELPRTPRQPLDAPRADTDPGVEGIEADLGQEYELADTSNGAMSPPPITELEFDETVGGFDESVHLSQALCEAIHALEDSSEVDSPLKRSRSSASLSDMGLDPGETDTPKSSSSRLHRPQPVRPFGSPAGPRSPRRILDFDYEEKPPQIQNPLPPPHSCPPGLDIPAAVLRQAAQRTEDLRVPGPESPVAISIIPSTPRRGNELIGDLLIEEPVAANIDETAEQASGEHIAALRARSSSAEQVRAAVMRDNLTRDGRAAVDLAAAIELDKNRAAELPAAEKMLTRVATALTQAICQLSPEPDDSDSCDDSSSSPSSSASSESSFGHSPRSPERLLDDADTTPLLGSLPADGEAEDTPDSVNDEFLVTPDMPTRGDGSSRGGRVLPFHEQDLFGEASAEQTESEDGEEIGERRYTREQKGKGRAEPLVLRPDDTQGERPQYEGNSEESPEDRRLRKGKGRAEPAILSALEDPVQIRRADISYTSTQHVGLLSADHGHGTWRVPDAHSGLIGLGYDLRASSPAPSIISESGSHSTDKSGKRSRMYANMDLLQLQEAEMQEVQMVSRMEVKLQELLNLSERNGASSTPDSSQAARALKLRNSIARHNARLSQIDVARRRLHEEDTLQRYPALCAVPSSTPMIRETSSIGPSASPSGVSTDSPQSFIPVVDMDTPPHELKASQISADERLALSLQEEEDRIAAAELHNLPAQYQWMYHDDAGDVTAAVDAQVAAHVPGDEEEKIGSGQSTPRASPTGHLIRTPASSRTDSEQSIDRGRSSSSNSSSRMNESIDRFKQSIAGSSGTSVAMSRSSGAGLESSHMTIPSSPRPGHMQLPQHLPDSINLDPPAQILRYDDGTSAMASNAAAHRGGGLAPAAMIESWTPTSPRPRHRLLPRPSPVQTPSTPSAETPSFAPDDSEATLENVEESGTPRDDRTSAQFAQIGRRLPSPRRSGPSGARHPMLDDQATVATLNRLAFSSANAANDPRSGLQAAPTIGERQLAHSDPTHTPPSALHADRRRRAVTAPAERLTPRTPVQRYNWHDPHQPKKIAPASNTSEHQQDRSPASDTPFRHVKTREGPPHTPGRNSLGSIIRSRQAIKRKLRDDRDNVIMPLPGAALLVPPGEQHVSPEPQNDDDIAHLPLVDQQEVSAGVLARARRLQEVMQDGTGPGILVTPPTPQQLKDMQERAGGDSFVTPEELMLASKRSAEDAQSGGSMDASSTLEGQESAPGILPNMSIRGAIRRDPAATTAPGSGPSIFSSLMTRISDVTLDTVWGELSRAAFSATGAIVDGLSSRNRNATSRFDYISLAPTSATPTLNDALGSPHPHESRLETASEEISRPGMVRRLSSGHDALPTIARGSPDAGPGLAPPRQPEIPRPVLHLHHPQTDLDVDRASAASPYGALSGDRPAVSALVEASLSLPHLVQSNEADLSANGDADTNNLALLLMTFRDRPDQTESSVNIPNYNIVTCHVRAQSDSIVSVVNDESVDRRRTGTDINFLFGRVDGSGSGSDDRQRISHLGSIAYRADNDIDKCPEAETTHIECRQPSSPKDAKAGQAGETEGKCLYQKDQKSRSECEEGSRGGEHRGGGRRDDQVEIQGVADRGAPSAADISHTDRGAGRHHTPWDHASDDEPGPTRLGMQRTHRQRRALTEREREARSGDDDAGMSGRGWSRRANADSTTWSLAPSWRSDECLSSTCRNEDVPSEHGAHLPDEGLEVDSRSVRRQSMVLASGMVAFRPGRADRCSACPESEKAGHDTNESERESQQRGDCGDQQSAYLGSAESPSSTATDGKPGPSKSDGTSFSATAEAARATGRGVGDDKHRSNTYDADHSSFDIPYSDWSHPAHREARDRLSVELEVNERWAVLEESEGRMMLPESARLALARRRQQVIVDHIISRGIDLGPPLRPNGELQRPIRERNVGLTEGDEEGAGSDGSAPLTQAEWVLLCDAVAVAVQVIVLLLMAWWLMKMGAWSWLV